ncbi:hypothetical protein PN492_02900 [Dolichospermum circinale CS-537/01]|uniref:Uncharacterized protein n=1 Tax=Dolichospermum circinale CS-537/01 TaxID=3021739 RepID=A0ABT5A302_9CYAN|nr:hypothetical protein [Dolichospermum circinale CS-537/01]
MKNCRYDKGTGNREQGRGFGQLYFSLLISVFFRSPTYVNIPINCHLYIKYNHL